MELNTVGIVGYGAFGKLLQTLAARYAPKTAVRVFSSKHQPDGKTFFTLADVAQSDAVVLAVPIHAIEDVLINVLPLVRGDTVIVDVATVKVHTVGLLKRLAGNRLYIATHPMWGPESYEKRKGDMKGFRTVISDHTLPEAAYVRIIAFLKDMGLDVVEMDAESHDKHLAETLFLTHFIGQIVSKGGFNRTEIDTASFGHLMHAVESVRHDTGLFRDVYTYVPYCKEILRRFNLAEKEVLTLLEK